MIRQSEYAAGGYNWCDVWRRLYDAERNQTDLVTDSAPPADYWATRAARFATATSRTVQPDDFMQFLLPRLRPEDTVLDVGAGTGRYVPSVARHVARLIALEPSPAMRTLMEQRIAEERLANVEIVPQFWPPTDSLHADVVFSAHVLYSTPDVEAFLHAMHRAARRLCVLSLMVRHSNTFFSPLWERFHGQTRLPLPGALEAYNVLHQLGYAANVHLIPANRYRYADLNEALHDIRQRVRLSPALVSDADLLGVLEEFLERNDDGSFSPPDQPPHSAVIWWEVQ